MLTFFHIIVLISFTISKCTGDEEVSRPVVLHPRIPEVAVVVRENQNIGGNVCDCNCSAKLNTCDDDDSNFEQTTIVPVVEPDRPCKEIETDNTNYDNYYLRTKEKVSAALQAGKVSIAHYYFSKLDETLDATKYLKLVIEEVGQFNGSSNNSGLVSNNSATFERDNVEQQQRFNTMMEFINGIFKPHLRLIGYELLLDNLLLQDISGSEFASKRRRQELFKLAQTLKSKEKEFISPGNEQQDVIGQDGEERKIAEIQALYHNLTAKFPQGIKIIVFHEYFKIQNIHDSYVFQYKYVENEHGHFGFTGKCNKRNKCHKSHLYARADDDFSLFTIHSVTLLGGQNCLGVKNNQTIFWTHGNVDTKCPTEKWQIKFEGKTLATFIYKPSYVPKPDQNDNDEGSSGSEGFALTRMGVNAKAEVQPTTFLNSYQLWLTAT